MQWTTVLFWDSLGSGLHEEGRGAQKETCTKKQDDCSQVGVQQCHAQKLGDLGKNWFGWRKYLVSLSCVTLRM